MSLSLVNVSVVVFEGSELDRFDILGRPIPLPVIVLLRLLLLLLYVVPKVPELAGNLRGRDAVGVVCDQSQQKHSVMSKVSVRETTHQRLVPHRTGPKQENNMVQRQLLANGHITIGYLICLSDCNVLAMHPHICSVCKH